MTDSVNSSYKVCNDHIFFLFSDCGTEQPGTLEDARQAKREYQNKNADNYVIFCEMIEGKQECRKI